MTTDPQTEDKPKNKNKILHPKIIGTVLALLILGEGIFLLSNVVAVKIWFNRVAYNRIENYIDCEKLPFFPNVEKQFKNHKDVVASVKNIPGVADFYPEKIECKLYDQGLTFIKGDAVLTYKSRSARASAQQVLGKDFFSIPYRGEPVR